MMKMKKILAGALAAGVLAWGLAPTAQAAPAQSDVTGIITDNHAAVADAKVTVTCNGKERVDKTDASGAYVVTFLKAHCDFGSVVKVVAQKDGKSGVSSGVMQGVTTKLNLAIVNVAVPEFGALGFVAAGTAGAGLMAYMRRRQFQSQV